MNDAQTTVPYILSTLAQTCGVSARVALITVLLFTGCAARPLVAMKADTTNFKPPECAAVRGKDRPRPVTVDADRFERVAKEHLVIFSGNVVARQDTSVQCADRMEVYLDERGDRILRTVSTGNVYILTKDRRTGIADRAEYHDLDQRVVLRGNARVWWDDNVVSGETITIDLFQDRSVVRGGKRTPPRRPPAAPLDATRHSRTEA